MSIVGEVSLNKVRYLISETNPQNLGVSRAEVSFVGRSNVGKSSLINALCGSVLARVSGTPGRTQTINVFSDKHDRWLVDLPGYGYAKAPEAVRKAWGPMIKGYLTSRPNLRMAFSLVDAKVGPTALDHQMHAWMVEWGVPWRIIATKADQVKGTAISRQRRQVAEAFGLAPERVAWVSALNGLGLEDLRAELRSLLNAFQ